VSTWRRLNKGALRRDGSILTLTGARRGVCGQRKSLPDRLTQQDRADLHRELTGRPIVVPDLLFFVVLVSRANLRPRSDAGRSTVDQSQVAVSSFPVMSV
jgi:hypothetical protein